MAYTRVMWILSTEFKYIMVDSDSRKSALNHSFYAISNNCIHKGGKLSEGSLDGKILTCPIHGSKFDVTTGKCIHRPRNIFSQAKTDDAMSYEVRLDGEDVLLYKQSPWGISKDTRFKK